MSAIGVEALYVGSRLLGFVLEHLNGFAAVTGGGRDLGLFNTAAAAARALWAAANPSARPPVPLVVNG